MNPIKTLPDFDWTEYAKKDILLSGQALLDATDFAWSLGTVAICGLIYQTFTSPPWFWFALAKGATLRDLIDFRRLAEHIPHGAVTPVEVGFERGRRFAEFYGFEDTGVVWNQHGIDYNIFRRK